MAFAFGLAAVAQFFFVRRIHFDEALLLYTLAVLVVWILRWQEESPPKEEKVGPSNPSRERRQRGAVCLAAAAALGGCAAHYLTSHNWVYLGRALLLYGVGLAFAAYAFSLLEGWGIRELLVKTWQAMRHNKVELFLLGIVLLFGLFLRLYRLDYYPPPGGISWNDEAQMGKEAHEFLRGRAHPWQFPFSIYLPALSFLVLGESVLALRLPFILMGFAMLIPFYFFVRGLFSPRVALVGTFLLAVSRWHISFTRLVLPSTPTALLGLLCFYFLFRGLHTGRKMNYAWAGMAMGLGLYSHASFRIVPLILFTLFLVKVVSAYGTLLLSPRPAKKWKRALAILNENYQGPLVFLITALLFAIPFMAIVRQAPHAAFTERFTSIMPVLFSPNKSYPLDLVSRVQEVFLFFNYRGEGWGGFNLPGAPMLDPFTGILFALGLGCCLFYFWRGENLFFLIWFFFTMIGGGVLVDTFRSHRIFLVIPVVYIFACVTLDWAWRELERALKLKGKMGYAVSVPLLVVVLSLAAWENYDTFFNRQIHAPEVRQEFLRDISAVANRIGSLGGNHYVYLLADFPFYVQGQDFAWMAGDPQGKRGMDITEILPSRDATQADITYIFSLPYDVQALSALVRRFYPASEVQIFHGDYNRYHFASCLVQGEEVESLRGLVGRYYRGLDRSGEPVLIRTDATISFDFRQPPVPPPFSVQWEGAIYAPLYGEYVFAAESEGESWVYLDGSLLIKGGGEGKATLAMGWHRFEVHYGAREEGGAMRLYWQPPGGERDIIPPHALSTAAPVNGLVGSYYRGRDWTGGPVFKRIDPLVLLACVPSLWSGRPSPDLQGQPYSVKWAGYLRLEEAGDYTFQVESQSGGTAVYIDDHKVLEEPGRPYALSIMETRVPLEEGWHEIEVRYSYQDGEFSGASLYWIPPFGGREVVPSDVLYPFGFSSLLTDSSVQLR
jgi:hypothetical protein